MKKLKKNIFVMFAVITIIPVVVGVSTIAFFNREMSNLNLNLTSEMAKTNLFMQERRDYAPPLFGGYHVHLRTRFILEQIANSDSDFILLVGDSICEGLFLPKIRNRSVLNGGIGGGRISDALELLKQVNKDSKLKSIIIAIGVNDTIGKASTSQAIWESKLSELIKVSKNLVGKKNVYLSTIIPVEKYKSLGEGYFNKQAIISFNKIIREKTLGAGLQLIEQYDFFYPLINEGIEFTTDGVHLNSLGHEHMKKNIIKVFKTP